NFRLKHKITYPDLKNSCKSQTPRAFSLKPRCVWWDQTVERARKTAANLEEIYPKNYTQCLSKNSTHSIQSERVESRAGKANEAVCHHSGIHPFIHIHFGWLWRRVVPKEHSNPGNPFDPHSLDERRRCRSSHSHT